MSDPAATSGTHSYYDWQLSTLLLAYDAADPLPRSDSEGLARRQQHCEREVREIALSVIPPDFQRDPTRQIPPHVAVEITRATVRRAAQIIGLLR